MTTHDVLAYAVATDLIRRLRSPESPLAYMLSSDVQLSSSRQWPQPDFVVVDKNAKITLAGEFKPPAQTKREYLTGLGQAMAYTLDFTYSALVVPEIADDGYRIGDHIASVLDQEVADGLPLTLVTYNPVTLSSTSGASEIIRFPSIRTSQPLSGPQLSESFYAKWRDASPDEVGRYLTYLYESARSPVVGVTLRDQAFDYLWADLASGGTFNLAGNPRHLSATSTNKIAWSKNFRNFVLHLGWIMPDGALTAEGLLALHIVHQYGSQSRVFLDQMTVGVLDAGKHLVLVNAIERFQNSRELEDETVWLDKLEEYLEDEGLLRRNAGRHLAATQKVERAFLKAEKTLWRALGIIVPRGSRVFHPGRGFIFNWERITSLLGRST